MLKGNILQDSEFFDVLVIGGGPAGTTAAALLSEMGHSVVLLEKNRHPRFHIGESLLPMNLPIFERLGVLADVDRIGIKKPAAEFNSTKTNLSQDTFYFANAIEKNHPFAYQVRRSEFDELLFENCVVKGVDARQGVRVTEVVLDSADMHRVTAINEKEQFQRFTCRFIIDASGRDTFLASKLKQKKKNKRHQMAAVYGHYHGVVRRSGADEGNISIYWFDHGWIWLIPLKDGVMSVGAVCWSAYLKTRTGDQAAFLRQTLDSVPEVQSRMQNAELIGSVQATANYSYSASKSVGDGFLLIGDAYAFVDPVFSSGVYLAMQGGVDGADLVDALLRHPSGHQVLIKNYEKKINQGIGAISWFIYRFNTPVLHRLLMSTDDSRNHPWQYKIKASVISILSGDVYGNHKVVLPLFCFKLLYYLLSIRFWQETLGYFWINVCKARLWKN